MTDIVARLRASAPYGDDGPVMREAADTIEALREQVENPPAICPEWSDSGLWRCKRPVGHNSVHQSINDGIWPNEEKA